MSPYPIETGEPPAYEEIKVKGNGLGSEQKNGELIFTIFKRLHQGGLNGDSGFGLALGKKVVEFHPGKISAISRKNDGVKFRSILPLVQPKGHVWKAEG